MAIYHLSAKMINRSDGRSATAAAAYRAGCEIVDCRTGEVHNYTAKKGVKWSEIILPKTAPERLKDRSVLWNEVEAVEKRKDAQLAREIEIALPVEMSFNDHKELVNAFVRWNFVRHGMIADIAIHYPDKGTEENPHAHIMLTTREITLDGFGKKNRDWNSKEQLEQWRSEWARYANIFLKNVGSDGRIDHRSLQAQGIDREPTIKMGAAATQMERRGVQTDRGDLNRLIHIANEKRLKLTEEIKELYQKTKQTLKNEWEEWFTEEKTNKDEENLDRWIENYHEPEPENKNVYVVADDYTTIYPSSFLIKEVRGQVLTASEFVAYAQKIGVTEEKIEALLKPREKTEYFRTKSLTEEVKPEREQVQTKGFFLGR